MHLEESMLLRMLRNIIPKIIQERKAILSRILPDDFHSHPRIQADVTSKESIEQLVNEVSKKEKYINLLSTLFCKVVLIYSQRRRCRWSKSISYPYRW